MKKILIGDNDQVILELMNDMLTGEGHQVVTAESDLSASGGGFYRRSACFVDTDLKGGAFRENTQSPCKARQHSSGYLPTLRDRENH